MSKQREALEFALEWIEAQPEPRRIGALSAIQTIREALDEPEQVASLHSKKTPRKPLTDVEMRQCANAMDAEPLSEGWKELIKFARAIERAHGIGGKE